MKQSLYGDVNQESFDYYIQLDKHVIWCMKMKIRISWNRMRKINLKLIQEMKQTEYALMKEAGVLQYDKGLKMKT